MKPKAAKGKAKKNISRILKRASKKRGRGRPRITPEQADRNTVLKMAAAGFSQEDIAKCIGASGIDPKTLRDRFRVELDKAAVEANAAVANHIFKMATTSSTPAWAIFWAKVRMGWKEPLVVTGTGPGGAIDVNLSAREQFNSRITSLASRLRTAEPGS